MNDTNEQEYENFIKNELLCDFQQSISWAKVKEFWKNEIVIVYDKNENIVATASILIRKISLFGNLMYIPRGPIGNIEDEEVLRNITQEIRKIAKKYNAFVVIIEPNIKKENLEFQKIAKKIGYHINSRAVRFDQEIQARHNFRLNLENKTEEQIYENFNRKTRYNIRLATRKDVVIKQKGKDGIDEFYELMKETGKRDCFRIRPKEYFIKIFDEFPENVKVLIAYYNNIPLAATIPILYGNKMWYLYGASGNTERNRMPSYLLQWEMIKLAIQNNCILYDFRGVCVNDKENGLYRFKKSFGGEFVELIGEIYIPFKPIKYFCFKIAKNIFFKCRNFIYWNIKNKK